MLPSVTAAKRRALDDRLLSGWTEYEQARKLRYASSGRRHRPVASEQCSWIRFVRVLGYWAGPASMHATAESGSGRFPCRRGIPMYGHRKNHAGGISRIDPGWSRGLSRTAIIWPGTRLAPGQVGRWSADADRGGLVHRHATRPRPEHGRVAHSRVDVSPEVFGKARLQHEKDRFPRRSPVASHQFRSNGVVPTR